MDKFKVTDEHGNYIGTIEKEPESGGGLGCFLTALIILAGIIDMILIPCFHYMTIKDAVEHGNTEILRTAGITLGVLAVSCIGTSYFMNKKLKTFWKTLFETMGISTVIAVPLSFALGAFGEMTGGSVVGALIICFLSSGWPSLIFVGIFHVTAKNIS